MNTQKLTQKSLEAIQAANGLAVENQTNYMYQIRQCYLAIYQL